MELTEKLVSKYLNVIERQQMENTKTLAIQVVDIKFY